MSSRVSGDKVRCGLVGAGAIAQTYATAFKMSEAAELVGVTDTRRSAAESLAEMAGCSSFASLESLISDSRPDALVICTPPNTHAELAICALRRQIHVLCEKPLAISSAEAEHMQDVAEENDANLTMASKFRYVEDVVAAKSLLESRLLGDVVMFENVFTARVDMSRRWNSNHAVSGGGVLIDNGTHAVDLLRYLFGSIDELHVVEGRRVQPVNVEDTVQVIVRSDSGAVGSIDLSWSIHKEQPSYVDVFCEQGNLSIGWRESKYRRSCDDAWTVFGNGYNKIEAFCRLIDNFARHLQGREPLKIGLEDALASVRLIESAYVSLHQGRSQRVAS